MKTLLEIFYPETMNLKKAREQLGLTQKELGEKLDLTAQTIYRMESGRQKITKTVELAVKYLQIKLK